MVAVGLLVAAEAVRRAEALTDQTAMDTWVVPEAVPTLEAVATVERADLADLAVITAVEVVEREQVLYCTVKWAARELQDTL